MTVAERTPQPQDFPGAPPEDLVAGGVVFSPPDHPVPLHNHLQWWSYVKGANWRHPVGPKSDIRVTPKTEELNVVVEQEAWPRSLVK